MHQILQSSLSFFEDGVQAERKLHSLISAFAETVSGFEDTADIWKTITTCTSILFQLPCPSAGRALIDLVLTPLLQKAQFGQDHASLFNISVCDALTCNLKISIERFEFLNPANVFNILNSIVTEAIMGKVAYKKANPFRLSIPSKNNIVIIHFYGVLFSKSTFLHEVYTHDSVQLLKELNNIYINIYVQRLPELSAQSSEVIEAIRSTVGKLFYHAALIDIDMISKLLSLNPLVNLLHSMQSRRGRSVPSHKVNLGPLSALCKDICVYAQTRPVSLLNTVRDRCMLQLSSMPFDSVPHPLRPFLLDDNGPLYSAIVIKTGTEGENAYVVRLFAHLDPANNLQDDSFHIQETQLYSSVMGQYASLMCSHHQFPPISSMPRILFSACSPESAPLGLFIAAILGEARAFTS